jgi:arginyl-tRNA synthetase
MSERFKKLASVYHGALGFFKRAAIAALRFISTASGSERGYINEPSRSATLATARGSNQIRMRTKEEVITMSSSLTVEIKRRLIALVRENFDLEFDDLVAEIPPKTELGDLAFPVAFDLAKRIKVATGERKNPRELATMLAEGLKAIPGVARVEVAGAGYLNVFFDRAQLFTELVNPPSQSPNPQSGKLIVEHTSINPNKAAHIGHVRNAVLGDTTVRILRAVGENVEVHNYIDNTGVQVADVVVGFIHLEKKSLDEIKRIAESEDRFDYYCWDLYARVGAWYDEDKTRLDLRAKALHEIEEGSGEVAQVAEYVSSKIVDSHLDTMSRLDISYDLLARESEIIHLKFWAHAFERLKASGAIVYETEGRSKGCWVMKAEEGAGEGGSGRGGEWESGRGGEGGSGRVGEGGSGRRGDGGARRREVRS